MISAECLSRPVPWAIFSQLLTLSFFVSNRILPLSLSLTHLYHFSPLAHPALAPLFFFDFGSVFSSSFLSSFSIHFRFPFIYSASLFFFNGKSFFHFAIFYVCNLSQVHDTFLFQHRISISYFQCARTILPIRDNFKLPCCITIKSICVVQ